MKPAPSPQSAASRSPDGPPAHIRQAAVLRNRAAALLQAGRSGEAEALLQEALRVFPGFAEAAIRIGNIRRGRGDAEGAEAHYRRALAIKPDYAWAHLELAILLQRAHRGEAALAHYRLAVRHNPKLYKTVLFAMVDQADGCFWLDTRELKRQLLGDAAATPAEGPAKESPAG
ncbi:MAG: hypothetical protein Kow00114_10090 [Kiloniellaceae bacterium]